MADALSTPFAAAALVLCVAGVMKLRSPEAAVRALAAAGIQAPAGLVRVLAAAEVVLGVACVVHPGLLSALVLGCLYAVFSALALMLVRRRSTCGCFGDPDAPAAVVQAIISAALAFVALAAAASPPHGIGWMLSQPVTFAVTLVLGTAGSVLGIVLAYTELPQAWEAWEAR